MAPPEGGLTMVSYVIGEQTRTILTGRLQKPLGMVSGTTMTKVAEIVRMLLGL
jgi:mRNA-degrading endonuclease toxin of MazEF toxin-antitoxin module